MKLLIEIDNKQAVEFEIIFYKLFEIAGHVLCSSLSKCIKNSLLQDVFLDDAQIALVSLIDNGTSKINEISTFRPISILKKNLKYMKRLE